MTKAAATMDRIEGPEGVSPDEIGATFDVLVDQIRLESMSSVDSPLNGQEILTSEVYYFAEPDSSNKGLVPATFGEEVEHIGPHPSKSCLSVHSILVSKVVSEG